MNDQNLSLKLVAEVEKRPVLYNPRLPGYSRKHVVEEAWNEVGKEVNMPVSECKERWKNIRAVFVRNMKPLHNGTGAKPKRAYYLLEAMQFTIPYIKVLGKLSRNLANPLQQEEEGELSEEIDYDNNDTEELETPTQYQKSKPSRSPISHPTALPDPPTPRPPASSRLPAPPRLSLNSASTTKMSPKESQSSSSTTQNKRPLKNDTVDETYTEYLERKKAKSSPSIHVNQAQKTDGLKMFLLSMLPDLLKMSDEQLRQFKRNTLDIVDDILSNQPMNNPQLSFPSRCMTPSSHSEILPTPSEETENRNNHLASRCIQFLDIMDVQCETSAAANGEERTPQIGDLDYFEECEDRKTHIKTECNRDE